ncbi:MAG: thermonuclease family protein [Gemmatimonadetes bacterium]|nr:thermonuclease family protein [Gemmatimonadota bacterium]
MRILANIMHVPGRFRLFVAFAVAIASRATPATAQSTQDDSVPRAPVRQTRACVVARIVDGDTFTCRGGLRVRLLGIDTPEKSQQPFGERARSALAERLPLGSKVLLERDVQTRDRYGRYLAYVWRDSVLVNWVMLRRGWAVLYTAPPNMQYVEHFRKAQRAAREEAAGFWSIGALECAPIEHRQGRCD